jgi:hypothetical protein
MIAEYLSGSDPGFPCYFPESKSAAVCLFWITCQQDRILLRSLDSPGVVAISPQPDCSSKTTAQRNGRAISAGQQEKDRNIYPHDHGPGTHVIFEPLDFPARLAALVPKPRVNFTRFHGVFAPTANTVRR